MSGVFDDREAWLKNPFLKREPGDFTPFYTAIAICTVLAAFLIILNVSLCCSRYREYWCDSNTGNRWVLPIWTKTPDKQPPLDLTELNEDFIPVQQVQIPYFEYPDNYSDYRPQSQQEEYLELHQQQPKRESDL